MPIGGGTSLSMTAKATRLHHRNLPLLLLQARERVISHFRPILNANGVTEQQWRIVRVLYEKPSLEPREIVELCRISSPSMAGVLARMAPQIDATYRRIERQIGEEFSERFQHALDQLLATLKAHEPGRRPARVDRDSGDKDDASLRGGTRGALQQELLQRERP